MNKKILFAILIFKAVFASDKPSEVKKGVKEFVVGKNLHQLENECLANYQIDITWKTKVIGAGDFPAGLTKLLHDKYQRKYPSYMRNLNTLVKQRECRDKLLHKKIHPKIETITVWTLQTNRDNDPQKHYGKLTELIIAVEIMFVAETKLNIIKENCLKNYGKPFCTAANRFYWRSEDNRDLFYIAPGENRVNYLALNYWATVLNEYKRYYEEQQKTKREALKKKREKESFNIF